MPVLALVVHQLSLSFGKGVGFTIGLLILGVIFYPILGFGDAEYQGPGGGGLATEPSGGGATAASEPAAPAPPAPPASEPESDESERSGPPEAGNEAEEKDT